MLPFQRNWEIPESFPKEVTFGLCKILASVHGLRRGNCLRKGQEVWQVFGLNIFHWFLQIHSSLFSTLLCVLGDDR